MTILLSIFYLRSVFTMNANNNGTRQNDITVEEVLQRQGLTQAVDNFLMLPGMMDMYHDLFVGSCEGLKAMVGDMPEEARAVLLPRVSEEYETAEGPFTELATGEFKKLIASMMLFNQEILGDVSGVALCYKMALESGSDALKATAGDVAEKELDGMLDAFKKSWLIHMHTGDVKDQDSMRAILKAAMGEDLPHIDECTVVPVNLNEVLHAMQAEEESED